MAYKYKLLYAAIFQIAQLESIKILILLLFWSLDILSQVTIHGKVYIQYFFYLNCWIEIFSKCTLNVKEDDPSKT